MSTVDPESIIAIIAWLGGACFCGLLPLGFAAILFFTARKRNQVGGAISAARQTTIAALRPGAGLLRLQGKIAPHANPILGSPENALVYLRMKVEIYDTDASGESASWRGLTDKSRGIPFQLDDGTGSVWVNPGGLDKQLLDEGIIPDEARIDEACTLLGIDPKILRGRLRFRLWEMRAGQTITVVGGVSQTQDGLMVTHLQGQPFVVSLLLGAAIGSTVSSQTKKASVWTLILGIPGLIFLLCGVIGALVTLIKVLTGG